MTTSEVRIVPVTSEKQRRTFAKFPWQLYRDDPNWVPPLYGDRLKKLDPAKYPFHEHAEVQLFLALRGEEVVGTISTHINHRHNEVWQDKVGFFGFFEVIEDYTVAEALLGTAEDWLRERGMEAIRGPESFTQEEECGLLVDGFDGPPVIQNAYNPRYYQGFVERAGFEKAHDLYAWHLRTSIFDHDVQRLPRKFVQVAERARQRANLVVRNLDMKRFDEELQLFKTIYNLSWEQNWGFVPLTDPDLEHLAAEVKPFIDPNLVHLAAVDGEPAGVSLGLPDMYQALLKARPQPNKWSLPWTLVKLLWHARRIDTFRLWAMGVVPEWRGCGIEAVLIVEVARAAFAAGYEYCEMGWTLESNDMINRIIDRLGGRIYRTYRIYEKPV
jgi:GNAT superfamily N-acetyltransferase